MLYADHSGRNVRGQQECTCSLYPPHHLGPQWAPGYIHGTISASPFPPPLFVLPLFAHLQMSRCMNLSGMFVCCARNPLLNYSCSTRATSRGELTGTLHATMLLMSLQMSIVLKGKAKTKPLLMEDQILLFLRKEMLLTMSYASSIKGDKFHW